MHDVPLGANGTLIPITGVIGDNDILRWQRYISGYGSNPFQGSDPDSGSAQLIP
jgi:hypothetical protein